MSHEETLRAVREFCHKIEDVMPASVRRAVAHIVDRNMEANNANGAMSQLWREDGTEARLLLMSESFHVSFEVQRGTIPGWPLYETFAPAMASQIRHDIDGYAKELDLSAVPSSIFAQSIEYEPWAVMREVKNLILNEIEDGSFYDLFVGADEDGTPIWHILRNVSDEDLESLGTELGDNIPSYIKFPCIVHSADVVGYVDCVVNSFVHKNAGQDFDGMIADHIKERLGEMLGAFTDYMYVMLDEIKQLEDESR